MLDLFRRALAMGQLPEKLLTASAALGAASALERVRQGVPDSSPEAGDRLYRNTCPCNCYDSCGQVTTVTADGYLRKVEGDPLHGHTRGRLCLKGYSYVNRTYSPDRIKYPMIQEPRGSGHWRRLSWDEALTRIATKILELKERYGSLLPVCLNKYSGNFGILHNAPEGMFQSMGYYTYALGTPCWPAGLDAQTYDMGNFHVSDPEEMDRARLLIIWGANPAWCAVHQMEFIARARQRGTRVVVIDPIMTATAAQADLYYQIKASTDGALALGLAHWILVQNRHDRAFLKAHTKGWPAFERYLLQEVSLEWASRKTGIPAAGIVELAEAYASEPAAMIWVGYGLQRHANGGQNIRAIDALAAICGKIGVEGGGVQYAQLDTWGFRHHVKSYPPPAGSRGLRGPDGQEGNRTVNMNNFAAEVQALKDPPVKLLWIACRNPGSQDPDAAATRRAFAAMEMVVVVDQFLNQSAEMADIVLPATSHFESWDINVSYWHRWVSINQPAIRPLFESKSDLQIAWALSRKMNELAPGSCTYPVEGNEAEWVEQEFTEAQYELFGIRSAMDLVAGPAKAKLPPTAWADRRFETPSGKYEFYSERAAANGLEPLPVYREEVQPPASYPIRFLTPHALHSLHSQFQNVPYMMQTNPEPLLEIHPLLAAAREIRDGDLVRVFNQLGEVRLKARVTRVVPPDTVVTYEGWYKDSLFNVNQTVAAIPADMGRLVTGTDGAAFYDTFVEIERV